MDPMSRAVLTFFKLLDISGCIITIDVMGTQKKTDYLENVVFR